MGLGGYFAAPGTIIGWQEGEELQANLLQASQRIPASRMRFSAYTALLNLPRLIVAMPRKTRIVMKSLAESLPVDAGSVRHFICRYAFVGLDGGEHDVADHLDGGEHDVADHVGGALLD